MPEPRIITFYLPQYHPIPENDEWWGKGFTDWINVAKARPRFKKHYQPQIPSELGFYDLRMEETRVAQAKLAQEHGIYGFCYHHYWFNSKMLLEKPFEDVLKTGKPDFPFCLCWANENWTRRWDGKDKEILIEQNYDTYNAEIHINWLLKAFSDNRYIKVNQRPLFLIYNPVDITNIKDKIRLWRKLLIEKTGNDFFLCSVKSVHNKLSISELKAAGFDAVVDFIPNDDILNFKKISALPRYFWSRFLNKLISMFKLGNKIKRPTVTEVLDYKKIMQEKLKQKVSEIKFFPCVIPSWDNSPRKRYSHVIQNNDEELYGKWLEKSYEMVKKYDIDEQLIFVNAWNEWAEGCHLEPDLKNGRKFLKATLKAVNNLKEVSGCKPN